MTVPAPPPGGRRRVASLRDAFGKTLLQLGRENHSVVALAADLSTSTKTSLFAKEFPGRHFNAGVAEQNMMGIAAGLAAEGKAVFASTFANFATARALDHVRQSICYADLPVKIVATHGGITVGEDGATHQNCEDIGLMRGLPNMRVVVPADAEETAQAVRASLSIPGPLYIRLSRMEAPVLFTEEYRFAFGKAVPLREGRDLTIISTGIESAFSLSAALILEGEGVRTGVLHVPTIKPLDREAVLRAATESRLLMTVEEHSVYNGLGSAVAEVVSEERPVPLRRHGIPDVFGESGSAEALLEKFKLDAKGIAEVARLWARPQP